MVHQSNTVAALRATDALSAPVRCLELLGGTRRFAGPGSRVLIKPNFGVPRPPSVAATTDPAVVLALADAFLAVGAKVAIGESCVTGYDLAAIYEMMGLPRLARVRGIDLVDLRADRAVKVKVDSPFVVEEIKIARTALEVDLIVNVPKMKTHVETGVTLAVKNLKGLLPGNEKARFHQLDCPDHNALEAAIADLNSVVAPTLNVVDGILAMEGGGPIEATPLPMQVMLAGTNRTAVDVAACELMGIAPASVGHLRLSAKRGLGPLSTAELEWRGDPAPALRRPFALPAAEDFAVPGVELIEAGACSACAGGIRQALRGMRDNPQAQAQREIRVFVGAKVEGPSGPDDVLIGNCAIRRLRTGRKVAGCPPLFGKMRVAMLRAMAGCDEDEDSVQDGDRRL